MIIKIEINEQSEDKKYSERQKFEMQVEVDASTFEMLCKEVVDIVTSKDAK